MNDGGNGGKSQTLMAVAELDRRKHEASRRADLLANERRALAEVSDCIVEEEQVLDQRLAAVRKDNDRLATKLNTLTRRNLEIENEIEALKREIVLLECRCTDQEARTKELDGEIDGAKKTLHSSRNRIYSAASELEVGRAALSRMDQRLSWNRSKR